MADDSKQESSSPLKDYSGVQPFVQKELADSLKDYITRDEAANQFSVVKISAHAHDGADSMPVDFSNLRNRTRFVVYRALDASVNDSVASKVGGDFVVPFSGFITQEVGATVDTAGVTGTMTVDINLNGTSIMANTKVSIATAAKTSRTNTTQPIVTVLAFTKGDIFTFDVDVIQTTPAKGLTVFMKLVET